MADKIDPDMDIGVQSDSSSDDSSGSSSSNTSSSEEESDREDVENEVKSTLTVLNKQENHFNTNLKNMHNFENDDFYLAKK